LTSKNLKKITAQQKLDDGGSTDKTVMCVPKAEEEVRFVFSFR